jgi:hypothetical protein
MVLQVHQGTVLTHYGGKDTKLTEQNRAMVQVGPHRSIHAHTKIRMQEIYVGRWVKARC